GQRAVDNDGYLKNQITQESIPKPGLVNTHPIKTSSSPSSDDSDGDSAKRDLDSCHVREVKSLPGSHHFGSDFIEAMASDPDPTATDTNVVWGLTVDLSSKVPAEDRALYVSKS